MSSSSRSGLSSADRRALGAVVLAAGRSSRMGREKALLPFARSTVLETILGTLTAAGVARVCVVLRPDLAEAARLAARTGAAVITNPDPDGEMLESIRLGAASLPEVAAFFVWPVDHPAVSFATVARLAGEARRDAVRIPTWRGRRGHPALVGSDFRDALARLPPGGGLRELWRARSDAVFEIEVADPGVVANVNTPEAYDEARRLVSDDESTRGPDPT